jgi:hypothetical protein
VKSRAITRILVLTIFSTTLLGSVAIAGDAIQDADHLARARAANQRCKILTTSEAAELEAYAAAANSGEAKAAAKRGTVIGNGVQCDAISTRGIRGVLQSARLKKLPRAAQSGAAPADTASAVAEPAPSLTAPTVVPQSVTVAAERPRPAIKQTSPRKNGLRKPIVRNQVSGNLRRYESLTTSYFRALRCDNQSRKNLGAFYADVINMHRKLVTIYGAGKVAATVRRAEARAKSGNC